ncbi:unnamed protein product [Cylicocyclus nassatus]|uniref:Uncharacterized protein n=1 Tax=Cylicocyclus nassatus TaxID=53992 RepID=A0AA36GZT7_CYLNA|nr:unnamed protein product [Cylicocyclus nassatus]
MAHSVDRSFCPSRCSERGVCFARGADYICVCYDIDVYSQDCGIPAIGSSTLEPHVYYLLWAVLIAAFAVATLTLAVSIRQVVRACRTRRWKPETVKPVISVMGRNPLGQNLRRGLTGHARCSQKKLLRSNEDNATLKRCGGYVKIFTANE